MTNFDIITNAAIQEGLYTKDEAIAILESGNELPLHTFNEWKNRGYMVRKGEHAKLTCQIWKPRKKKEVKPDEEEERSGFYMTKAFFFTEEQVEAIG